MREEVEFGLHHLVVISDERGDKFRFVDFPGLAEALVEAAWEVAFIVHGVPFHIAYDPPSPSAESALNVLDGCYGTSDLPARVRQLPVVLRADGVESPTQARYTQTVLEAGLVLRNMSMLEENAAWLADMPAFRDLVVYTLHMPRVAAHGRFGELLGYTLEAVEQVCPYWPFVADDPLVGALAAVVTGDEEDEGDGNNSNKNNAPPKGMGSADRTRVLLALRILVLWAIDRPDAARKRLPRLPRATTRALERYLLLEQDQELLSATLDLVYQYTSVDDNAAAWANAAGARPGDPDLPTGLARRLVTLLMYDSLSLPDVRVLQEEERAPPATTIPSPPPVLRAQLARMPEPDRCSAWLRCCFAADSGCEITQLALWHAYQAVFAPPVPPIPVQGMSSVAPLPPSIPTLAAADFINTVSATFRAAEAQVVQPPGESARFIIRGIRPLDGPRDLRGWPFLFCRWRTTGEDVEMVDAGTGTDGADGDECAAAFTDPAALAAHVFEHHLELPLMTEGELAAQEAGRDGKSNTNSVTPSSTATTSTGAAPFSTTTTPTPTRTPPANPDAPAHPPRYNLMLGPRPHTNVCRWARCRAHPPNRPTASTRAIYSHMLGHLPGAYGNRNQHLNYQYQCQGDDSAAAAAAAAAAAVPPPIPERAIVRPRLERVTDYYVSPADEMTGEPVGIGCKALLVLRNLVRGLREVWGDVDVNGAGAGAGEKMDMVVEGEGDGDGVRGAGAGVRRKGWPGGNGNGKESAGRWLLGGSRARLLEVADYNKTLRLGVFELLEEMEW